MANRGEKNLLDINFKNSFLIEVNRKNNDIELVIDIDTYMFPGKPFGVLRFIGVKNAEKLIDIYNKLKDISIKFIRVEHSQNSSGKADLYAEIELKDGIDEDLVFSCQNFWLDRIENYKQYKHIFL